MSASCPPHLRVERMPLTIASVLPPSWPAPSQSQPRIATLLTLNFKASGELLHVGNTHWDDQGVRAREHSGRMLREILPAVARKVEQKYAYGDGETLFGGVVLIGDLSASSTASLRSLNKVSTLTALHAPSQTLLPRSEATSRSSTRPRSRPPFQGPSSTTRSTCCRFGPRRPRRRSRAPSSGRRTCRSARGTRTRASCAIRG